MYRSLLTLFLAGGLIGCGGGGNSSTPSSPTPTIPTSGSTAGSPAAPAIVQVTAGQPAAGVNISVPPPTGTQANAQDLGVAPLTGSASAFNTGDIIHEGTSMRVVLFGPGLSSNMQVSILGPNDFQISNVIGVTASDTAHTPGLSFTATVAPNAALGARTVVLQSSNGNITTFTGGLEVVP